MPCGMYPLINVVTLWDVYPMKQATHITCFIGLIWLLTNFILKGQRTNVGVGSSPWISSCP